MRLGVIRTEPQCLLVLVDGFRRSAGLGQSDSEIHAGHDVIRVDPERLFVLLDGLPCSARLR